jgi:hypothetical protein
LYCGPSPRAWRPGNRTPECRGASASERAPRPPQRRGRCPPASRPAPASGSRRWACPFDKRAKLEDAASSRVNGPPWFSRTGTPAGKRPRRRSHCLRAVVHRVSQDSGPPATTPRSSARQNGTPL